MKTPKVDKRSLVALVKFLYLGGRRRMLLVIIISAVQAFSQAAGVASVGILFAAALSPEKVREGISSIGWQVDSVGLSDAGLITTLAAGMSLVVVISGTFSIAGEFYRHKFAFEICLRVRKKLLAVFSQQPYEYFTKCNPSHLLNTLQAVTEQSATSLVIPSLELANRSLVVLVLGAIVVWADPLLAVISLASISLGYFAIFYSTQGVRNSFSSVLHESGRRTTLLANQYLQGIKTIRVHQAESHFENEYLQTSKERAKIFSNMPFVFNAPKHLLESLVFVALAVYLIIINFQGGDLAPRVGALSAIAFAMYRIMPSIQMIYMCASQITSHLHLLDDLAHVMQSSHSMKESVPRTEQNLSKPKPEPKLVFNSEIRLHDVSFCYSGMENNVLDNVSFRIRQGQSIGVTGPSGCGKSTMVDILLGLFPPTTGNVTVDGKLLTPASMPQWRAQIGYVPQDVFLIDDTIARNIAFGMDDSQIDLERIQEVCHTAQIDTFVSALPKKLNTVVGDRGVRMSGGQRQRLALARALYRRPKLLILDEATSALDSQTETALMASVESLQGRMTIIMVAHRLSTLDQCDVRVELNSGRLKQVIKIER